LSLWAGFSRHYMDKWRKCILFVKQLHSHDVGTSSLKPVVDETAQKLLESIS
jgi:hypothetical protein